MEDAEMRQKQKGMLITVGFTFVSIGFFLLLWTVMSTKNPDFLPSPLACIKKFQAMLGRPISKVSLGGHIWASLKRVLLAVLCATVIGIPLGLAMGWSRKVNAFVSPIFEFLRPIPPIAWIPLVILWFGVGEFSKVFLVTLGAYVPILMNTVTGVKMVPPVLLDVGKIYKASSVQILKEIVLPAALPAIFAGLKTAVSSGWMIVLAAEMMASKSGVGFLITRGMEAYDVAMIIVGMCIIGIVGYLISICLSLLERRLCPWKTNLE